MSDELQPPQPPAAPPQIVLAAKPLADDKHPAKVYLARFQSVNSRRSLRSSLDTIARTVSKGLHDAESFPWQELRYPHVLAIRGYLAGHYKPASANRHICALRGVLKEVWRLGYVDADTFSRTQDVGVVKGDRPKTGRALSQDEVRAMVTACQIDTTPVGVRDTAILCVAVGGGLRRAEIVGLNYHAPDSTTVPAYDASTAALCILGKGNKTRTVYLPKRAKTAMEAWITWRGTEPGAMFWSQDRGRQIQRGKRLYMEAIGRILKTCADAGEIKAFTPHDLRRTYITRLLDAGEDINLVRELAGHSSLTTTAGYDRRGEEAKRAAIARLPDLV